MGRGSPHDHHTLFGVGSYLPDVMAIELVRWARGGGGGDEGHEGS